MSAPPPLPRPRHGLSLEQARWVRFAVLVSLLAGLALFAARTWPTSVEELRGPVEQAGAWAPLVFVVGYVAAAVALVLASLLTVAGGVLFGPAVGAALVLIAATVGATVAFGLARWLGGDGVRAMLGGRLASVDRWIGDRGFTSVLVLRLVPLFPYNVLNYAVGLTGVTWRAYVLATVMGLRRRGHVATRPRRRLARRPAAGGVRQRHADVSHQRPRPHARHRARRARRTGSASVG